MNNLTNNATTLDASTDKAKPKHVIKNDDTAGVNMMVSFPEFIWIWYSTQTLSFPRHHKKMADWLSSLLLNAKANDKKGLLMAFRNSGKSTIVGLFCAWVLLIRPSTRILILAADYELAKKMVRNVKRIIERHPLTICLLPETKEQWAADRFTVARDKELRDASVMAQGIGGNITGSRAEIIICDDVEVPKNCDTETKRSELRAKLSELDFILTPNGMILYVGTPHTFYTIYNTNALDRENPAFLKGYHKLKIPVTDNDDNPVWPERFPLSKIEALRKTAGPARFAAQMMLEPVNYKGGRLDADRLLYYDDELNTREANGALILNIGGKQMLSVSCWWDPAFGKEEKADASVIACVFTSDDGLYRLHDIEFIKVDDTKGEKDIASAQVDRVCEFIKRNYIPAVHIETNGLGKFLPSILRQKLIKEHINCAVLEESSHKNKSQRIIEAFDAPLAARALYVNGRILNTPFIRQLREWQPCCGYKGKDDAIDAVAGCLLAEPVRMISSFESFGTGSIKQEPLRWQGLGESFLAKSDFDF